MQQVLIISTILVAGIFVLSFVSVPTNPEVGTDPPEKISGSFKTINLNHSGFSYQELQSNIRSGGPPPDGIPPIEDPVYLTVSEATSVLLDDDIVFGFNDGNGNVLAFPQYVMVWHEIVNEQFNDLKISFTYCPLTGSAVGFVGHFLTIETTFGTSGKLLNSNLVMYDRDSDSLWPQILGESINGDNQGQELEKVQLFWTTWGKWSERYPSTLVLSQSTGFSRNYGSDPYGETYYSAGGPLFPVMEQNNILPDKSVVIGIDYQNEQTAIQKSVLQEHKIINTNVGSQNVSIFYDEQLDVARVYKSNIDGQDFTFKYEAGKFIDIETNSTWTIDGESSNGNLESVVYFDVMWFAWFAYNPNTTIILFE
ncbi:MAG: DUF3179 domain-containing protein [Candidatus Hodarchaeales archaeon]